jgi:hypothetical protein
MERVAARLGGYGVDGIFVDSYGFQKDHACVAPAHGHPLGDPEVFNRGAVDLLRRLKAALRSTKPDGVVFMEGPVVERLFEHADGSFDNGIYSLVTRWLWDAQGKTDTLTTGWSIDHWNQIVALGGKILCPPQLLELAPGPSATAHYDHWMGKEAADAPSKHRRAVGLFQGIHHWRNAGLILGLTMPGLDDVTPRRWERAVGRDSGAPDEQDPQVLAELRRRALAIDAAFGGRKAPLQADYVKSLLEARASLAKVIDYEAAVSRVQTGFPRVAAWRFTGPNGSALTCVNVADEPRSVSFSDAAGVWRDGVNGETFRATNGALSVSIPTHRVRLLRPEA